MQIEKKNQKFFIFGLFIAVLGIVTGVATVCIHVIHNVKDVVVAAVDKISFEERG